jgi:hypothetical protein
MQTRLFAYAAASLVAIVTASCATSTTPPDQSVDEFCTNWAKAYCQLGNGACNFDATSCEQYQDTVVCPAFVNSLQGGTRTYSQANGAACIAAINDVFGGSPSAVSISAWLNVQSTCGRIVSDNLTTDKPCTTDADCAQGLVCANEVGTTTSVCASQTPIALGNICGDPGDQCQDNAYCAPQSGAAPLCVATPGPGGTCSATVPCGTGYTCVTIGSTSTCQTAGALGASCSSNDQCASGFCDLYPPAACTNGLSFARGSADCEGIAGTSESSGGEGGVTVGAEAGAEAGASTGAEASVSDAPTGG